MVDQFEWGLRHGQRVIVESNGMDATNQTYSFFTKTSMAHFEIRQSGKLNLTSYSGLALIGQCCQAAQVDLVIDPKFPVSQRMRTSSVAKFMIGLLSLVKRDFEPIKPLCNDRFFKQSMGLVKVPMREF